MAKALTKGLQYVDPLRGSPVTILASLKLRLKTTQIETLLKSCPEGNLMGGNCPGVVVQGGII